MTRQEEVARGDQGVEAKPVVTKEAAMDMFWSNQIVAVQEAAGEDRTFYMNHLPRPEGGQSANYVKPSMFFSITSQAKQPEAAAMFIDYFTNNVDGQRGSLCGAGRPHFLRDSRCAQAGTGQGSARNVRVPRPCCR